MANSMLVVRNTIFYFFWMSPQLMIGSDLDRLLDNCIIQIMWVCVRGVAFFVCVFNLIFPSETIVCGEDCLWRLCFDCFIYSSAIAVYSSLLCVWTICTSFSCCMLFSPRYHVLFKTLLPWTYLEELFYEHFAFFFCETVNYYSFYVRCGFECRFSSTIHFDITWEGTRW